MSQTDRLFLDLLTQERARREFSAKPREMLRAAGADQAVIEATPETIDPKTVDLAALQMAARLHRQGIAVSELGQADPGRLARVMDGLKADANAAAAHPAGPGDQAVVEVSIIVLIVMVVTAGGRSVSEVARSALSLSREGGGLVLHGPGGLKVTGLGVGDVATVVKNVMR